MLMLTLDRKCVILDCRIEKENVVIIQKSCIDVLTMLVSSERQSCPVTRFRIIFSEHNL